MAIHGGHCPMSEACLRRNPNLFFHQQNRGQGSRLLTMQARLAATVCGVALLPARTRCTHQHQHDAPVRGHTLISALQHQRLHKCTPLHARDPCTSRCASFASGWPTRLTSNTGHSPPPPPPPPRLHSSTRPVRRRYHMHPTHTHGRCSYTIPTTNASRGHDAVPT